MSHICILREATRGYVKDGYVLLCSIEAAMHVMPLAFSSGGGGD